MSIRSDPWSSFEGQSFIVLFLALEVLYINFKFTCLTKISKRFKKENKKKKSDVKLLPSCRICEFQKVARSYGNNFFFIETSFKTRKAVCRGDVLQGRLLYSKAPETTYACVSVRVGAIYAPKSRICSITCIQLCLFKSGVSTSPTPSPHPLNTQSPYYDQLKRRTWL